MRNFTAWRALPAELVQSRRFPDGVIEIKISGALAPDICILEIATYPDSRVPSQAVRDTALVYLARDILPEVVVLFLHPKGNVPAAGSVELQSRLGFTKLNLAWRAVKLWEIPAAELLAADDVGLIPWVPLAKFDGSPEAIVEKCRARIESEASPLELENLLALTQVLAGLRYNDPRLFQILGGRQAMIESPVLKELIEECTREAERKARRRVQQTARDTAVKSIMTVLVTRFGSKAAAMNTALSAIAEQDRLNELLVHAVTSRSLSAFRNHLSP